MVSHRTRRTKRVHANREAIGEPFAHGPTNLPPRPYPGESPWKKTKGASQNIHITAATRVSSSHGLVDRLLFLNIVEASSCRGTYLPP